MSIEAFEHSLILYIIYLGSKIESTNRRLSDSFLINFYVEFVKNDFKIHRKKARTGTYYLVSHFSLFFFNINIIVKR